MTSYSNTIRNATVFAVSIASGVQSENAYINVFSNENTPSISSHSVKAQTTSSGESPLGFNIEDYKEWNNKLERRFDALIVKTYTKKASKEELHEFKILKKVREKLKSPMSADEIIAEMNREKAVKELILALENYRKYVG